METHQRSQVRSQAGAEATALSPARSRKEIFFGLGTLLLVLVLAYFNILFRGQSLVSTANYHPFDYRLTHLRPGQVTGPVLTNWHDQGVAWWQWEPAAKFFRKAFRQRQMPTWDPNVAGGINAHVAVVQSQYFPPYVLLLLLGDTPLQRDIYYLLLVFGSGCCCFFLLWRHGFHHISAAAMGVIYMLGGAMTQNVNSVLGQTFAVLPAMVLAADWFLDWPSWRRTGVLALVVAFGTLGGFLPIAISGYLLLALRLLAQPASASTPTQPAWNRLAGALAAAGKFTLAILLAVGLTAFLIIPLHIAAAADPAFQSWYSVVGLQHYELDFLFTLVSPSLTYDVWQTLDPNLHFFPKPHPWWSHFFYVGLIPLLLVTLARWGQRPAERRLFFFFAGATAFLLLKLFGVPPFQWLAYLPVFRNVHFIPYFCGALTLALSGLAALGVESLIRHRPPWSKVGPLAMAAAGFFALFFWFVETHKINPSGDWRKNVAELARLGILTVALVGVVAMRRCGLKRTLSGALVLAVVCLELIPMAYRPRYRRADVWSDPPEYVRFLQSDRSLFRVHGVHDLALTANVFQGLGLSGISSRSVPNPARYGALLRRYFETPVLPYPVATSLLPKSRGVLDLLNVKYLVTYAPSPEVVTLLESNGLQLVHKDGLFQIFGNPACWPRAYLAGRVRVVNDAEVALREISGLQSYHEVILEEPVSPPWPQAGSERTQADVRVLSYGYDQVTIEVRASNQGILVLLDNYAPGWTVAVDGRPERLLAANYAFRGVRVPAGRSVVAFRYRPPGLQPGIALSAGCLLAVFCLVVGARPSRPLPPRGPHL